MRVHSCLCCLRPTRPQYADCARPSSHECRAPRPTSFFPAPDSPLERLVLLTISGSGALEHRSSHHLSSGFHEQSGVHYSRGPSLVPPPLPFFRAEFANRSLSPIQPSTLAVPWRPPAVAPRVPSRALLQSRNPDAL